MLIAGCARRLGRWSAWLMLRTLRLFWPPAWSRDDFETFCALMSVAAFFLIAALLLIYDTGTEYKDPTKLDLSDTHREELIQDLIKQKGWKLVEEEEEVYDDDDDTNIIKPDDNPEEIESWQRKRKPRYRIINLKENEAELNRANAEYARILKEERSRLLEIEKDRNRVKKDSQERMQLPKERKRKKNPADNRIAVDMEIDNKEGEIYKKEFVKKFKGGLSVKTPVPPIDGNEEVAPNPKDIVLAGPPENILKWKKGVVNGGKENPKIEGEFNKRMYEEKQGIKLGKVIPKMKGNFDEKQMGFAHDRESDGANKLHKKMVTDNIEVNRKKLEKHAEELLDFMKKKDEEGRNLKTSDKQLDVNVAKLLKVYNLSQEIKEDYECMSLNIKPLTYVCLYPTEFDVHISRHIRAEGIWEPHIVKEVQVVLFSNPDIGLIDIGANIGMYSLIAATMGHSVVAIEPYIENIKHLQKAAQMNNISEKILLLKNAISDTRGLVTLHKPSDNQGGISLVKDTPCGGNGTCLEAQTLLMDDLLSVIAFRKAIMKIDIEGHEHRAFRSAKNLIERIYVPFIFMEWRKLRHYYGSEVTDTEDKNMTFELVAFLLSQEYAAYSLVTGARLKAGYWYSWPDDIVWKHLLQDVL